MDNIYRYRAYGSIMLFGEHAVMHQGYGICIAIDQSITATLKIRSDQVITVSTMLGDLEGSTDALPKSEQLNYLSESLSVCSDLIQKGFDLSINSAIDIFVGLGSSAAVMVSTIGAICKSAGIYDEQIILTRIMKALKNISPRADGCDCVASLLGCTVAFNPRTMEIIQYKNSFDITALYSGTKAIRDRQMHSIEEKRKADPVKIAKIYGAIDKVTKLAMRSLENNDLYRLGEHMNLHQEYQKELGSSTDALDRLAKILKEDPSILGVKISGSGGGDCVIGLGNSFIYLPLDLERSRIFHLKTVPGR